MNHIPTLLIVCMSVTANAFAANSIGQPWVDQTRKLANASVCEVFRGDRTSFGAGMNRQCRENQRADFDAIQDRKSLRDCIKPGNVIDDDVRKCMKGL